MTVDRKFLRLSSNPVDAIGAANPEGAGAVFVNDIDFNAPKAVRIVEFVLMVNESIGLPIIQIQSIAGREP